MKISLTVLKNTVPVLITQLKKSADTTKMLREIGFGWLQLIRLGFAESKDPYGKAWLPTRRPGQPLLDTGGTLRDRFAFQAGSNFAEVGTNVKIAQYHQSGTTSYRILPIRKKALFWKGARHPVNAVNHPGLPKRQMIPESQRQLPSKYQKVVTDAFTRLVSRP